MKKAIVLASFPVLCAGCASAPSEKAAAIRQIVAEPVGCQMVGMVSGSSGHWGPGYSRGVRNSQIEALEAAAELNATHVQWAPTRPTPFATFVNGFAYRCPTETPHLAGSHAAPLPVDPMATGLPLPAGQPAYVPPVGTGQSQIHTPNAFGPGIHMDQYGRPVTVTPGY